MKPIELKIQERNIRHYQRLKIIPELIEKFDLDTEEIVHQTINKHHSPIEHSIDLWNNYQLSSEHMEKVEKKRTIHPGRIKELDVSILNREEAIFYAENEKEVGTTIFTDASQIGDSPIGIAVVYFQKGIMIETEKFKLEKGTVFEGEMEAVKQATIKASTLSKKVSIISDSESTMRSLKNPFNEKTIELSEIIQKGINQDINFSWTPSHCGVSGNEVADETAKKAIKDNNSKKIETKRSLEERKRDLKRNLRTKINKKWQKMWLDSNTGCWTKKIIPLVNDRTQVNLLSNKEITTNERTLLCRMVSGHLPVKSYLARFNLMDDTEDSHCEVCNKESETIEHLLFRCPKFDFLRFQHRRENDEDFNTTNCLKSKIKLTLKILKTRFDG